MIGQDIDDEQINRESRDFVRAPRSISLSLDIPSDITRKGGPPLITELSSVPERRTLFDDDDETYETRVEKSQIVDSPFHEDSRAICSEEPRLTLTGSSGRPVPPIESLISSSEPPGVSITGILGYGGGPTYPCRPGTVRTGTGTATWKVASGGGGGGDDSSSDHSHQSERRSPGRGSGPPRGGGGGDPPHNSNGNGNGNGNGDGDEGDESSISSHRGPPGPKDCKDPWVPRVFKNPEDFKVIVVFKDPLVDRAYKVYVVYLEKKDHLVLEALKVKYLLFQQDRPKLFLTLPH